MIRYNSEVKKVRIFALQLNNDIRGLDEREEYIESLISRLDVPELVVLPELSQLSYIGNTDIWQYADQDGQRTASWAMRMAEKYHTIISAGYLEAKDGDYYNAYMIADSKRIFGKVYKSEGESFIFKRGDFPCIIETPFGNVAVGICYRLLAKLEHISEVQTGKISRKTENFIINYATALINPKPPHGISIVAH